MAGARPTRYRNAEEVAHYLQSLPEEESGDSDDEIPITTDDPAPAAAVSSDEDDVDSVSLDRAVDEQVLQRVVARDGTEWTKISDNRIRGQTPRLNVFRANIGPTPYAIRGIRMNSPLSAFRLFVDEPMIRSIQRHTNSHIQATESPASPVTPDHLEQFIGLQIARGVLCASNTSVKALWDKQWGPPLFSNTMSRNLFECTMQNVRFDDRQRRRCRLREDRFCLVSEVWDSFVTNCQRCYIPSAELTIDEQLFPCKTRCPFTQYMASKPDKFGLKFWFLVDNNSKYLYNARPYLGRDPTRRAGNDVPHDVCMKLMQPLYDMGYNVTTDNFFSSLKLANALAEKNTSIVGTVRRQRREIPDGETLMRQRDLHASEIYSTTRNGITTSLTIYKAKRNKIVYLLSTMHPTVSIDTCHSKKLPETIAMYNRTKVGVDVLDQMARYFTCKSGTRRWPMAVFFNILDISCINAWVLYQEVTGQRIPRRDFLLQLVMEMCRPTQSPTRISLSVSDAASPSRHHCQIMESGTRCKNKSNHLCQSCSSFCCGRHIGDKAVVVSCVNCAQ